MPKEPEGYRDVVADLLEFFGGKRNLSIKEVASYDGCDWCTAAKRYDISRQGININILARRMFK